MNARGTARGKNSFKGFTIFTNTILRTLYILKYKNIYLPLLFSKFNMLSSLTHVYTQLGAAQLSLPGY